MVGMISERAARSHSGCLTSGDCAIWRSQILVSNGEIVSGNRSKLSQPLQKTDLAQLLTIARLCSAIKCSSLVVLTLRWIIENSSNLTWINLSGTKWKSVGKQQSHVMSTLHVLMKMRLVWLCLEDSLKGSELTESRNSYFKRTVGSKSMSLRQASFQNLAQDTQPSFINSQCGSSEVEMMTIRSLMTFGGSISRLMFGSKWNSLMDRVLPHLAVGTLAIFLKASIWSSSEGYMK